YFLNKSTQTSIDEIDRKTKLKLLMKNIHRPNDEESIDNMIEVINNLIDLGSIYHFDCENNINSARVLQTFLEDQI
ncbi:MAG: hypothetical protein CVV63_04695, partial [Tenericutes bacterium HGW-Tenericutes-8]